MSDNLLEVRDLQIAYTVGNKELEAVSGANFDIPRGRIVGLVGESGCGKSTMARSITRVLADNARISGGRMLFDGTDLVSLTPRRMNQLRWREIAFVPQSAMNSLDPVYTVAYQLAEVLKGRGGLRGRQVRERSQQLFEMVGIDPARLSDFPHQFSGGMRQRVAIALALALDPKLIIADEPVTALDVIVQRQILDQFIELQRRLNLSLILVTHDVSVVAYACDRTIVMYAGKVVESGDTRDLIGQPAHPYTMGLKNAFPDVKHENVDVLSSIKGSPPSLLDPPVGCRFADRCPFVVPLCREQDPPLTEVSAGHFAACHRSAEASRLRLEAATHETWLETA